MADWHRLDRCRPPGIAQLLNQFVEINAHAARDSNPQCLDDAKEACLATLDALIEHTRRHFLAEEAFLRDICFPGYAAHRGEHVLQIAEFTDLRRALAHDDGPVVGSDLLQECKRWFFNHVMSEDRDYVDYYHQELRRPHDLRAASGG